MRTNEKETICGIRVERETEKAIQFTTTVSWNSNCYPKTLWVPKSIAQVVVSKFNAQQLNLEVAGWWVAKTSVENCFHNYNMHFEMLG